MSHLKTFSMQFKPVNCFSFKGASFLLFVLVQLEDGFCKCLKKRHFFEPVSKNDGNITMNVNLGLTGPGINFLKLHSFFFLKTTF